MEWKDRIASIVSSSGLSAAAFASQVGVQRSGLSHILNGRNKPSIDLIEKILAHYPATDLPWLLTGEKAVIKVNETAPTPEQSAPTKSTLADKPILGKQPIKVLFCYADGTFDTFAPNEST